MKCNMIIDPILNNLLNATISMKKSSTKSTQIKSIENETYFDHLSDLPINIYLFL